MVSLHTSPVATPGTGDAGGMNIAILSVAEQLAARGAIVDLVTRANGEPSTRLVSPGVTLHELAAGPLGPLPKQRLAEVVDEFGEAVAVLTGRLHPRYDLIHAHYWLSGLATLPVALELGLPFVQSFHTVAALKNATLSPSQPLSLSQTAEPERRLLTESYLANQASAIVAGSAAEATALIELARAPAEKIWVIPPGVDIELFTPDRKDAADSRIRAELQVEPGRSIIAVVARVQPLKDQALAIQTLASLRAHRAELPLLVIAGEPTPGAEGYLEALRELAVELDVADSVRFVGALSRDHLADLLAVAALTVMPSHSETFGIVALESAASGTPVVAFHGSGLVEAVADGVSGVLVGGRDPADWAGVIADLLADDAALRALGASARDHSEALTWAATATATLALYGALRGE
jgi:D-inositol-3-phosphate glycosyltransferase